MFQRQANIPRLRQSLAFQAAMEGLTGTELIIADAAKVTGTAKTAMSARVRIG
jgi:hypothetical protein